MKIIFRLIILCCLFFTYHQASSQSVTGCWQGYSNGEKFEINIEQKGAELCGYTYDRELDGSEGYCKANFQGRYDKDKKIFFINGTSFIENSGGHVLMRIILWRNQADSKSVLRGKVYLQSSAVSIFGMGGDDIMLKKIADSPKKLPGQPASCFPKPPVNATIKNKPLKPLVKIPEKQKPVIKKTPPLKPVTSNPAKPEKPVLVQKDSEMKSKPEPVKPVIIATTPNLLERTMTARKQSKQGRITVDVNQITLKLYDNGTVDNDSVSIFYNGRLLLSHQRLSEKAIELTLKLDEGITEHQITLFAENLGSIAPNTALVVVTAGNKRYELHSNANLEENAVLIFEYKPK